MSLATTCTHCGTCFRVVQDQLRVSGGWVRCGHCQQVFNALESLFDLDAPNEPAALPSASEGRGVWQTEASARWMRRRAIGDHAPTEREEPLSDDMLAALQAEAAPALPGEDDPGPPEGEEDDPVDTDEGGERTDPSPAPAADPATEPVDEVDDVGAADAEPASFGEVVEPAPLGNDASGETAFAPFPVTERRQEPVFETTSYEPRGYEATPATATGADPAHAPVAPAPVTPPSPDIDVGAAQEDEDEGPASAAMFLSSVELEAREGLEGTAAPAETPLPLPPATEEETPTADAPPLPSFLAAPASAPRWEGTPAARGAFVALAMLLSGALALQVAWHWRERLAMAWPILQPPLVRLCQALPDCALSAPREINAVVVDNTTIARAPGTAGYRLTVQLHNRAQHPVAVPSIDLTLTDAQGAVVARRVLAATDFDYREGSLAAQAELQWTAEFALNEGSLVGYTVAAFYP